MIVRSGALVLTAEQCAVLAGVLGDGVRVRQARGERIGTEVHELLGEVETLARAWRATAASGSAAESTRSVPSVRISLSGMASVGMENGVSILVVMKQTIVRRQQERDRASRGNCRLQRPSIAHGYTMLTNR